MFTSNVSDASITPSWYGKTELDPTDHNISSGIEILAMNLLSTELKMRTCERRGVNIISFSDDVHSVRTNIPYLLKYSEVLMECDLDLTLKRLVASLQARCHWLAGIFYVWWSQNSSDLSDIKEMEKSSLQFIDKAILSLGLPQPKPIDTVYTPHLSSHGRVGSHWIQLSVQTLADYRDQIESSTVISRVRQKFQNIVKDNASPDTVKTLVESIENDLFERYQLRRDRPKQNFDELMNDFVDRHRDFLSMANANVFTKDDSPRDYWGGMWDVFPSKASSHVRLKSIRNPSLLTMVIICYHKRQEMFATNVSKLLAHLVICVIKELAKMLHRKDVASNKFVADDSDGSSDESSCEDENAFDPKILLRMSQFLIAKLEDIAVTCDDEQFGVVRKEVMCALDVMIGWSAGLEPTSGSTSTESEFLHVQPSVEIFTSSLSIMKTISERVGQETDLHKNMLSTTFTKLVRLIIHGKTIMLLLLSSRDKNHLGRSECHALVMLRAKYVAAAASELASMLSCHSNVYLSDGQIEESFLVHGVMKLHMPSGKEGVTVSPLVRLAESLAWFWNFLSSAETIEAASTSKYVAITNTVHKYAANHLLVPIAGGISALCGAVGHGPKSIASIYFSNLSSLRANVREESLSDFFASDDSARYAVRMDDDENAEMEYQQRLLQTLSRTVQSIGLVFSNYEDGELSVQPPCVYSQGKNGFSLSLIVVRVLTAIADFVMVQFAQERQGRSRQAAIWDDEYPFGFRCAGAQLDLILHRAYRCLHGINISASHLISHVAKDAIYPHSSTTSPANKVYYLPESTPAAIKLYRCMKRAYSNGRRSIPSDVLGCISTALPKMRETEKIDAIKKFIFGNRGEKTFNIDAETPTSVESAAEPLDKIPRDFPLWLLEEAGDENNSSLDDELQKDISVVRKGLAQYLAEGPIPSIGLNSESNNGVQYNSTDRTLLERKIAADCEIASNKKLCSIIKALHYDSSCEKKWYRAGLCIGVKLNIILDRLIPAERGLQNNNFYPPSFDDVNKREKQWSKERGYRRDALKLLSDQRRTFMKIQSRRHGLLGSDLAVYLDHQFCNPQSLKKLQDGLVGEHGIQAGHQSFLESMIIEYGKGNLSSWQRQWGSCFVTALRLARHRCFHMAMFLERKKEGSLEEASKEESIYTEVAETLGTAHYDSIGFSIRDLTKFEKRKKAQIARSCFRSVLECLRSSIDKESDSVPATWEPLFMIGKVS